ncbi:hypothetical protein [Bacillus rhizoplanae]|uniref:hypothetical protein n=1 Tax=Bacillus rhizoplanae TaxID=2880966 RepID=UPI003D222091
MSLLKRKGNEKKWFGLTIGCLVLWMVCTQYTDGDSTSKENREQVASAKDEETIETEKTVEIKTEFLAKADAVTKKIDEASKKSGWIEQKDFPEIKKDLQLLTETIGMEHEVIINDNESMRNKIMDAKKKISSFSNEEAKEVYKRLEDASVIYQAVLMDDFHNVLEEVNMDNVDNDLSMLASMNKDSSDVDVIKQAQDGIKSVETYTYPTIQQIEKNFGEHSNVFSDKEFKLIGEAVNNLKSSTEKQLKIMKQFDGNGGEEELDYGYLLQSAKEDYKKAEANIESLESSWNIVYMKN